MCAGQLGDVTQAVKLREAADADVDAIAALINTAYVVEAFFKIGDRTNAAEVRERMRSGRFLLLDAGRRLAGCVFVSAQGGRGYFGTLAVAARDRGTGLGSRLVWAAEQWCRDAGCTELEIEVVNLREELPPYYRRLGYLEQGTRPFPDPERISRPCHFIVMTKSLG
jgi:GNAT superfamily N-acetyltransferase